MQTIVTWVWKGERNYSLEHASLLSDGLRAHMRNPYRLVVFSDLPGEVRNAEVYQIPLSAQALAGVKTPESNQFPSSYRRLWLFSDEARALGEVVLMVDVDVVVTGDWTHLFAHQPQADFMGWRPNQLWGSTEVRIGGGVWRLRIGTKPHVWRDFALRPQESIQKARSAGYRGSDQAWISYSLKGSPVWPAGAGILSVRDFNRGRPEIPVHSIPAGTCMVHFNGHGKPWQEETARHHLWMKAYFPPPR